jgi:GTP-dependent phosphoenolpyruvate carboxykinase
MNTDSTTAFTNTDCCANPYVNKQQTQETKTNMKKILMEVLTAGASLYLIALAYHVVTASFHIADIKLVHYAVVGYLTVKATAFLRK